MSKKSQNPELEAPSFASANEDGHYALYQRRGYVVAAPFNEPFSFDGNDYEEGVLVVPDDGPAFVLSKAEFDEHFIAVSPTKQHV